MTAEMILDGVIPEWTTGDRLRKAREFAGLSQSQMAEQIGISRGSVGHYESGRYTPSRPVFIAWALRTGVELAWLVGESMPDGPPAASRADIPAGITVRPDRRGGHTPITTSIDEFRRRVPLRPADERALRAVAA